MKKQSEYHIQIFQHLFLSISVIYIKCNLYLYLLLEVVDLEGDSSRSFYCISYFWVLICSKK
jgi:hypothetical protein